MTYIVKFSPILVGGKNNTTQLAEQHTEGEIRHIVDITQKTIKAEMVGNMAGFFVETVSGNYTNPKQKIKK